MGWIDLVQDWDRAGTRESGNETSCSVKFREFLD